MPALPAGTSIDALSDSITIIGSSAPTTSLTATQISVTSTSSMSPKLGRTMFKALPLLLGRAACLAFSASASVLAGLACPTECQVVPARPVSSAAYGLRPPTHSKHCTE